MKLRSRVRVSAAAKAALSPLDAGDLVEILRATAERAATPLLQRHFADIQGLQSGSEEYRNRKGNAENFVKTGDAKAAIDGPTEHRKITVGVQAGGSIRASIMLVKEVDSVNVYNVAQKGGRNGSGVPMPIARNQDGDASIVTPIARDEAVRVLKRKGIL